MTKIYIVFKTSILNMCYEIEEFDKAFSNKIAADKYVDEMKKVSDYKRYVTEETVED